jgi:RNA polymerase sigma factor (TIGR02999 family)
MTSDAVDLTRLLHAWSDGDESARDRLFAAVYANLRLLAASYLRRERRALSLQPTLLVHEAFLKLADTRVPWRDRAHFFGVAAQAMRRILVDHARRRDALKRGRGCVQVTLDAALGIARAKSLDVLRLDELLESLSALDARQGKLVELRFFGGLSIQETSEVLGVSPATVKRDWETARAWLSRELLREGRTRSSRRT